MACQGHLERPRGRELMGWVWDPASPGERIRVDIEFDGALLRTRVADGLRPDLEGAGIGDGRHAFSVDLPPLAFDGNPHTVALKVTATGEIVAQWTGASNYLGSIESVDARAVRVEIYDEFRPETPIEAELFADGRFVVGGPGPELRLPTGFDISRVRQFALRTRGCEKTVASWSWPVSVVPFAPTEASGEPVDIVVLSSGNYTANLRTLESLTAAGNEHPSAIWLAGDTLAEDDRARLGVRRGEPSNTRDRVEIMAGAVVYGDWLDRLRAAAYSHPEAATVSPLTGGPVDGHSARSLDDLCRRTQPGSVAHCWAPSRVCCYRRSSSGNIHLLAGGVRVEALRADPEVEDPTHDAHVLRRGLYEQLPRPPLTAVTMSGGDTVTLDDRLRYRLPQDLEALRKVRLPRGFVVDAESAHCPPEIADLGVEYAVEVRDYGWICPRGDFVDETGRYCGEPVIEACERCLRKLGPREGWGMLLHRCGSVAELREQSRRVLEGASVVRFPSPDVAERFSRYFNCKADVSPAHGPGATKPVLRQGETLRVALAGPANDLWQACIWDAAKRELPLEFVREGPAHVAFRPCEGPTETRTLYEVRMPRPGLPAGRVNDFLLREFFA